MLFLNVLPLFQPERLACFLIDEHECVFYVDYVSYVGSFVSMTSIHNHAQELRMIVLALATSARQL